MTISVVIIADTHSRPLVIVIDAVSLFRDNEQRLFTIQGWRKTYEDAIEAETPGGVKCSVQSNLCRVCNGLGPGGANHAWGGWTKAEDSWAPMIFDRPVLRVRLWFHRHLCTVVYGRGTADALPLHS